MTLVLICDINFQADEREQHVLIIIPLQNKPRAQTKEERRERGGNPGEKQNQIFSLI